MHIGLLLYPQLTQLDLTGPYEVFARMPGATVHLVWKARDPVVSDKGLAILPTTTFAECPQLEVICVPGGPGQTALMDDQETLDFLRRQAAGAKWITSVCSGSLISRGRRADQGLSVDLPLGIARPARDLRGGTRG